MEKEEAQKRKRPLIKRVSLFKKRKKPTERPLVRVKKQRNYTKLIINIALVVIGIFIIVTLLYIIRNVFLPGFVISNNKIIVPQGSVLPDKNQMENIIRNHGMEVDRISFASSSATVSFYFNKSTQVILSTRKEIVSQLDLVEAIDNQLKQEDKRAIYIDLRYNKPIVKLE